MANLWKSLFLGSGIHESSSGFARYRAADILNSSRITKRFRRVKWWTLLTHLRSQGHSVIQLLELNVGIQRILPNHRVFKIRVGGRDTLSEAQRSEIEAPGGGGTTGTLTSVVERRGVANSAIYDVEALVYETGL